jgi:hypothetical protein
LCRVGEEAGSIGGTAGRHWGRHGVSLPKAECRE